MSSPLKEFEHLRIPLQDIKLATNNFGETNLIGSGGFGKVYRGELVICKQRTMVAMKRLDTKHGQGPAEFWREVMLLSTYKHENLVTLLGFSNEKGESILVYEFLYNKSLDLYLSSTNLSWNQRLRICIGAAKGLQYLHAPLEGSQHNVLHRDIKSANILLDHNWNPKIADFGLSKFGLANQQVTYQFSTAVGTMGYCDPLYVSTGLLTKESDVYSFGVVLFEVLCGRQCVQILKRDNRPNFLTVLALKCYEENTLSTIISTSLKEEISCGCLERFSKIAIRCLQLERKQRPSMTEIVKELQIALEYQDEHQHELNKKMKLKRDVALEFNDPDEYWRTKLPRNLDAIIKMFKIPHAICSINKDLFSFLRKGLLFDGDKQYFWINDDGKKCLAISPDIFFNQRDNLNITWKFDTYSRFAKVAVIDYEKFCNVKCHIETSMLSLGTWYTARLLFRSHKQDFKSEKLTKIKWKTNEMSICSTHVAKLTNKSYAIDMWNFINRMPIADFDIVLEELSYHDPHIHAGDLIIQGFEFQPTKMMQHDMEDMDNDDEEYWEKKLPDNYQRFIRMSNEPLKYNTKKELYIRLCEGFLGHQGESRLWFFIRKSAHGICSMLPANDILKQYFDLILDTHYTLSDSSNRFHEVIKIASTPKLIFKCRLQSLMFTPHYIYACYFVFKFQHNQTLRDRSTFLKSFCKLDGVDQGVMSVDVNLFPFNIPTIKPTNDDGYGSHESSNTPIYDRVEMQKEYIYNESSTIIERKDGWMEFMLCKPSHHLKDHKSLDVRLFPVSHNTFNGMIIEGIEFRPLLIVAD